LGFCADLAIGILGIAFTWTSPEPDERTRSSTRRTADFAAKGLLLSLLAGFLGAVYGSFALKPRAGCVVASSSRSRAFFRADTSFIFPFPTTGAFLTTAVYCLWLPSRHQDVVRNHRAPRRLGKNKSAVNWAMALLTGCLCVMGFLLQPRPCRGSALTNARHAGPSHMIMLILSASFVGPCCRQCALFAVDDKNRRRPCVCHPGWCRACF